MDTPNRFTSACRCCQHYTPEGRRGGHCHQLHVPVKGSWRACPLAIPAFAPSWERVEPLMQLKQVTPTVQEVMLAEPLSPLPDRVSV